MAPPSPFDQLVRSFGNAITDVREKLVEEAWFGRTTAAQERMSEQVGNELGWTQPEPAKALDAFKESYWQSMDDQQRERGVRPLSFDEMAALYSKGQGVEPDHEIDRDRER